MVLDKVCDANITGAIKAGDFGQSSGANGQFLA
jgi:hypothetical protein